MSILLIALFFVAIFAFGFWLILRSSKGGTMTDSIPMQKPIPTKSKKNLPVKLKYSTVGYYNACHNVKLHPVFINGNSLASTTQIFKSENPIVFANDGYYSDGTTVVHYVGGMTIIKKCDSIKKPKP
jgi:hypothetical protein